MEGEAGIGKSALLAVLSEEAASRGCRVFAAQAEEMARERPFGAIAEALGCRRRDSSGRRHQIAQLLEQHDPDVLEQHDPDAAPGFHRLVDAFEDLVESEALRGPTLLVMDDLQWADAGSLQALAAMARSSTSLPLAIVLSMRRTPRSAELSALLRAVSKNATQLRLEPLEADALRELVAERLGAGPGERLMAQLARAGGNPFYVEELLAALATEGSVEIRGDVAETEGGLLPSTLVLTVLSRLSALTDTEVELLRAAAVLGGSVTVADLRSVVAMDELEFDRALSTLRAEGLLTDAGERMRFRHELIREAIYDDLGEPVRVEMHRRIGWALAEAGADAIEVAAHLTRGAGTGDRAAAEWLVTAARDPTLDSAGALALLERALEVDPVHPKRPELVRWRARLLFWQGRFGEAIPLLHRILGDEAEVAGRLEIYDLLFGACLAVGRERDAFSWVSRAQSLAHQIADDDDRAQIAMARIWFYAGDIDAALLMTERAADRPRAQNDEFEAELHNQASWLSLLGGRSRAALTRSERALALRVPPMRKPLLWRHHALALADLDRVDEADTALGVARVASEESGLPTVLASVLDEMAYLRYACGRWDEATADAEAALAVRGAGPAGVFPRADISAWISYHRQQDGAGPPPQSPRGQALAAVLALEAGESERAAESAAEVIAWITREGTGRRRGEFDLLPGLARVCLVAARRADAEVARDWAERVSAGAESPGIFLAMARLRTLVDADRAGAEEVVGLAMASPRLLFAAEALEDAASVLDGDGAVGALQEALDRFRQIGGVRGHSRVLEALRRLGAAPDVEPMQPRPASGWDSLSPAEVRVVRLAVEGLTNREIGAKLFISHRTAASHLSHAFEKLGLRSRVELAREAGPKFASR